MLLDVPFSAEEGSVAVAKLKTRKAAGPDGLTIEHLKAGWKTTVTWLLSIYLWESQSQSYEAYLFANWKILYTRGTVYDCV